MGALGSGPRYSLHDPLPQAVVPKIDALRTKASVFLAESHADKEANVFCRECSQSDDVQVLRALVSRDARVLRQRGNDVVPGPAFQPHAAHAQTVADDDPGADAVPSLSTGVWPDGVSFRIRNLFLLNADLHGELDRWLLPANAEPIEPAVALEEAV
jgi:hypothetical protein